jgi:hypothetical protein
VELRGKWPNGFRTRCRTLLLWSALKEQEEGEEVEGKEEEEQEEEEGEDRIARLFVDTE